MKSDNFPSENGQSPAFVRPLVFVSVGDISAQEHALRVVKCFKNYGFSISAVGGSAIKNMSDKFIGDTISLETFGFTPSLPSILGLWKIYKKVIDHFRREKPSAALLVDFFGFNSKIATAAKNLGIPVYYYIPPQVWATRYGRIEKIRKFVDKVFLTLPFEEDIYRREGINHEYVGHPLVEKITDSPSDGESPYSDASNRVPIVGFFPGSRANIVKRHIPILNAIGRSLKEKIPQIEIKLFGLSAIKGAYRDLDLKDIKIVFDADTETRRNLNCALSVSGTIATELALMKIPTVIFYRVSALNAFILKRMIKVKYVALPNIILQKEIFPEYLQSDLDTRDKIKSISDHLALLIEDKKLGDQIRSELGVFRRKLAPPSLMAQSELPVSAKVADSIIQDIFHKSAG